MSNDEMAPETPQPPAAPSPAGRPKFRQRTFPGKPLPDNEVIHANQVAAEIEDEV